MKRSGNTGLLEMMRQGGEVQNRAIQLLWKKTDRRCRRVIRKGRGTDEDLMDTRQEATMLLYLAISEGTFRGETDAELITFFNRTFLFAWMGKVRKRDKMPQTNMEETISDDSSVEELLIQLEAKTASHRQLKACLDKLNQDIQQIVQWRYFEIPPISWQDIAQQLNLGSAQAAQNKGGRGMKQLRICMGA